MHNIIKNAILFTIICLFTACSNNFLNENLTSVTSPVASSNIFISPDWESANYVFILPSLQDVDYEIVSKPAWLTVGSVSGQLSDSIAHVQCSVEKYAAFSAVGIYMDFMTVKADGKNYKVPVTYITEGNPKIEVQSSVSFTFSNYGYPYLQIQNTGLGILMWNVVSMPDWLAIDTARLESNGMYISQYNGYNIPFTIIPGENATGNLTGTIVLATNDKEHPTVTINVSTDLGTAQLNIYSNAINFASNETSKTLSFSNYGNGILVWKFENLPDWLSISPSSGRYNPYTSYDNVVFTCDRSKLSPGQNTAIVTLKSNDTTRPNYSITVTAVAPGNNENTRAVDGNIIDVVFNKKTNTLYYVTSAPNKFIAYDVKNREVLHEIALSKAPTAFAISEDWTKAAVGHNSLLTAIDLTSNTVTANYNVDFMIYDMAWAENDWFCYTQNGGSFTCLHWINTANGSSYDDTDKYSLDGSSMIKKVPGNPYIIATRGGTSPSGFFAFDIANKSKKSYSHMTLSNFWFSEDGEYVFASNLNVYRTSSSTGATDTFDADINAIGKINFSSGSYYGLNFLYHSNHALWLIQNDTYTSDSQASIYQFEDNDYTMVRKIPYNQLYQPDTQTNSITVKANSVFANNDGTEISVLCKSTTTNTWIIQFIPVK